MKNILLIIGLLGVLLTSLNAKITIYPDEFNFNKVKDHKVMIKVNKPMSLYIEVFKLTKTKNGDLIKTRMMKNENPFFFKQKTFVFFDSLVQNTTIKYLKELPKKEEYYSIHFYEKSFDEEDLKTMFNKKMNSFIDLYKKNLLTNNSVKYKKELLIRYLNKLSSLVIKDFENPKNIKIAGFDNFTGFEDKNYLYYLKKYLENYYNLESKKNLIRNKINFLTKMYVGGYDNGLEPTCEINGNYLTVTNPNTIHKRISSKEHFVKVNGNVINSIIENKKKEQLTTLLYKGLNTKLRNRTITKNMNFYKKNKRFKEEKCFKIHTNKILGWFLPAEFSITQDIGKNFPDNSKCVIEKKPPFKIN